MGLAALAYKIHPSLFWGLVALAAYGLFSAGEKK
jgi:hypothetical protein